MSNASQASSPLAVRSLKQVVTRGGILNKSENHGSLNKSGLRIKELNNQFTLKVEKQLEISQAEEILQTEPSILLSKSMANPKMGTHLNKPFIVKKQTHGGAHRAESKFEVNQQLISKQSAEAHCEWKAHTRKTQFRKHLKLNKQNCEIQSEMNPFSSSRQPTHGFGRLTDFAPKTTYRHDILSMTGYNPDKEKYNQDYARSVPLLFVLCFSHNPNQILIVGFVQSENRPISFVHYEVGGRCADLRFG